MTDRQRRVIADLLDHAALVLVRDGWCQHEMYDARDRCCALGAIDRASFEAGPTNLGARSSAAGRALRRFMGDPNLTISAWNDVPTRTLDQVVDSLHGAATMLRNETEYA